MVDVTAGRNNLPVVHRETARGFLPVVAIDGENSGFSTELSANVNGSIDSRKARMLRILGRRDNGWASNSALGDVAQYLDGSARYVNTPSVGTQLYLVSTSANDAQNGTGVQKVRVVYLDADGFQQVESFFMNGTTPVPIGNGISYIQWIESDLVGSAIETAGNISVTSTNGAATVATTFERIASGGNKSMSCRYKVPKGKDAYMIAWSGAAIGNTMDARVRANVFTDTREVSPSLHFQDAAYIGAGQNISEEMHYMRFPEGSEIKIAAIPGGAQVGVRMDCSFSVLIIDR